MANKSISELTAATTMQQNDLLVLEQNGVAKKMTGTVLLSMIDSHGGIASTSYTAPVAPSLQGTLTLTFTDGTTYDVPIMNGAKGDTGAQGAQGIQGIQGEQGVQGVQGVQGEQGNPAYVWIKWASVQPTSDSDMSDTPSDWMGIYGGSSSTAPTAYTSYAWYNIKGATGATGATGAAGDRGSYIWYATQEAIVEGTQYWVLSTALNYPGEVPGYVPRRGDLIFYGDRYYVATGLSSGSPLRYNVTAPTSINSAALPGGGTSGQVLAKASGTDYDVEWVDQTGGSSDVAWMTYGTSTSADIEAAYQAGQIVVCLYYDSTNSQYCLLPLVSRVGTTTHTFCADVDSATSLRALCDDSIWSVSYNYAPLPQMFGVPLMDGTAEKGTSLEYSRKDHVHPSDTSRQAKITASGILKGDGNGGVTAATAGTDYLVSAPVTSVNGQTGAVSLSIPSTAADVGAVASSQGVAHAGDFLVVGNDGNVTTVTMTAWQGGSF